MNAERIYHLNERRFLIAVCLFDVINDRTESVNFHSGETEFLPQSIAVI